jgi:thiamine-monophosphate kinase
MANDAKLGEFELIDRFFAWSNSAVPRPDVILGIGDDAAVLRLPPDTDLVAAVDTLVVGRHFPAGSDPRSIGHRALAVNLSDLAAMGATPQWATLALTLPSADRSCGLRALGDAHGVASVGGDTTAGPLTISIQVLGHVTRGSGLRRGGAQPGDLVVVTGTLGDAGAGLRLVLDQVSTDDRNVADELIRRFEYPTPRVQFGCMARGIANAAMDLSDGLAGDLPKLATVSGLAAHIDVGRLPLSQALRSLVPLERAREWALSAGDDYELLVTVTPARVDDLRAAASRLNLTLTVIGEMHRGTGVSWTLNGLDFQAPAHGYDHFR